MLFWVLRQKFAFLFRNKYSSFLVFFVMQPDATEICILFLEYSSIFCFFVMQCDVVRSSRECCALCSQCEGHLSILQFKWMSTQIALHRHRESGRGCMVCINGLQRCLQEERVQIGGIGSWLPSSCLPSTSPGFQAEDPDGTVLGHLMTIIFLKDGAESTVCSYSTLPITINNIKINNKKDVQQ